MPIPALVGGLAGPFLKNYIGKNFGGVPSRDANNAAELEEARLKGGEMGIVPGMNVNQGFTEPYGDPRENLKNALGGLVGGSLGGAVLGGENPWKQQDPSGFVGSALGSVGGSALGGALGSAMKKGKFPGPIGGLASTFF